MYAASSDARNATTPATSSGVVVRPSGIPDRNFWWRSPGAKPNFRDSRLLLSESGVTTYPGQSAFTVTLCGASATAIERVRLSTPALLAAYVIVSGLPPLPAPDARLT